MSSSQYNLISWVNHTQPTHVLANLNWTLSSREVTWPKPSIYCVCPCSIIIIIISIYWPPHISSTQITHILLVYMSPPSKRQLWRRADFAKPPQGQMHCLPAGSAHTIAEWRGGVAPANSRVIWQPMEWKTYKSRGVERVALCVWWGHRVWYMCIGVYI